MCLPELSVKKADKLRPFLNFQLQVTSSYFKFLVIARRHPIGTIRNYHGNQRLVTRGLRSRFDQNRTAASFATAPLAADLVTQMSMNKPPCPLSRHHHTTRNWDCNYNLIAGFLAVFGGIGMKMTAHLLALTIPRDTAKMAGRFQRRGNLRISKVPQDG
jgi:hypothetical protein